MSSSSTVIQWVLDTRSLWPSATQTSQLPNIASRALNLLPKEEQDAVLRFYHVRDAKLALGSKLLKRFAIARYCDSVSWHEAVTTRDERTKPVFRMPRDGSEPLVFNVSHQAGLVVLLAVHDPPPGLAVGVDVVCPSERRDRDHEMVRKEGWLRFVEMHADVFAPGEVAALEALSGSDTDRKLRYFYALWCLREAYVKMTGEALLAPWLKDLEMVNFAPPDEMKGLYAAKFNGQAVQDVDIRLTDVLDEYMFSTAVRRGDAREPIDLGAFEILDINDVLEFGEKGKS